MNSERADYIKVELSPKNPFGLSYLGEDHRHSLSIEEPQNFGEGTSKEAQDLLRTVMLAHLTVRHFPKTLETNFEIGSKIFLDELYKHYGFGKPKIVRSDEKIVPQVAGEAESKGKISYANAHSGGLDSIYRVAKLLSEDKKVVITHLRNLNPTGTRNEAVASHDQAKVFASPYEEVLLKNGTDNTGFAVMRTRDMFLGLVTAMVAQPYRVKKVLIEGDMQVNPKAHFSEYAPAWEFFNKLIREVGLNSQVEGMDAHDIETIGEVLTLERELTRKFGYKVNIIPLVQNCFTPQYRIKTYRGKWERITPVIARNSSEHWCGSCPKCRRMTLGRISYGDPRFAKVPQSEVDYFVKNTYQWLKGSQNNRELASESFMRHLDSLAKK